MSRKKREFPWDDLPYDVMAWYTGIPGYRLDHPVYGAQRLTAHQIRGSAEEFREALRAEVEREYFEDDVFASQLELIMDKYRGMKG